MIANPHPPLLGMSLITDSIVFYSFPKAGVGNSRIPKSKEEEWDMLKKLEKLRHAKEHEDWDWIRKIKMRATGLRARRGWVT